MKTLHKIDVIVDTQEFGPLLREYISLSKQYNPRLFRPGGDIDLGDVLTQAIRDRSEMFRTISKGEPIPFPSYSEVEKKLLAEGKL